MVRRRFRRRLGTCPVSRSLRSPSCWCSLLRWAPRRAPAAREADEEVSRTNRTGLSGVAGGAMDVHTVRSRAHQRFSPVGVRRGARSVRSVTVAIQPSGDGVFTVTEQRARRAGARRDRHREIEDVRFAVGDLVEEPGRQPHYTTRIVRAERRFADDPASAFARDGVKLALYVKEGATGTMEVRFDTPEGTGLLLGNRASRVGASTPRGESRASPWPELTQDAGRRRARVRPGDALPCCPGPRTSPTPAPRALRRELHEVPG